MARDLYVMLYMFGGGQDSVNYATTSNTLPAAPGLPATCPVYQDWQLAEMAQFAINIVDSLDRDDTISMFEYDKNLADGWNLDDDPITAEHATVAFRRRRMTAASCSASRRSNWRLQRGAGGRLATGQCSDSTLP